MVSLTTNEPMSQPGTGLIMVLNSGPDPGKEAPQQIVLFVSSSTKRCSMTCLR